MTRNTTDGHSRLQHVLSASDSMRSKRTEGSHENGQIFTAVGYNDVESTCMLDLPAGKGLQGKWTCSMQHRCWGPRTTNTCITNISICSAAAACCCHAHCCWHHAGS